mgnify:CR=1 FL=1
MKLHIYDRQSENLSYVGFIEEQHKTINLKISNQSPYHLYGKNYSNHNIHPHLRDSSPDNWGRRVIHRIYGDQIKSELEYLALSNFGRIGNLVFSIYPPEQIVNVIYDLQEEQNFSLSDLQHQFDLVDKKTPIIEAALNHGTSIGGARPKDSVRIDNIDYIAKFGSTTDVHPVVESEFIAMTIAKQIGLNVADVKLEYLSNEKPVLLVKRFDRERTDGKLHCKPIVSALTVLQLDEMTSRYASYADLAGFCRGKKDLFKRIVFNLMIGNTDDHARNHSFFWNDKTETVTLTPIYDIAPIPRKTNIVSQAMILPSGKNIANIDNVFGNMFDMDLDEQKRICNDIQIGILDCFTENNSVLLNFMDKTRLSFVINQLKNTVLNESLFYNQNKVKPLAALSHS